MMQKDCVCFMNSSELGLDSVKRFDMIRAHLEFRPVLILRFILCVMCFFDAL